MPDIQENEPIVLRPGDEHTYEFAASASSSASANDGSIPYSTSVASAIVKGYKNGEDVSSDLISGSATVAENIISVKLIYPDSNGGGMYELRFALTLDNGEVINYRMDNVEAVEDDS